MKNFRNTMRWAMMLVCISVLTHYTNAQEYDDMYFNKKDRKKVSFDIEPKTQVADETLQSFNGAQYDASYYSKSVNPDFLARYSSTKLGEDQTVEIVDSVEYYPEEEEEEQPVVINNYYGNNFNQPWAGNQWMPNTFIGWNNWTGFNMGFNMTFGSPFMGPNIGFYDPWFGPMAYDPWFDPFFFNDPWMVSRRWRNNFWWDPWSPWGWGGNRFHNGYAMGFWDGYATGLHAPIGASYRDVIAQRGVVRGARYTRGGTVTGASRSSSSGYSRRNIIAQDANSRSRSDYSRSENEFYSRSGRVTQNNGAYSRSTVSSRTVSSSSRAYESRSSSRSGSSVYDRTSRSGSSGYSRTSSSGSRSSYSRSGSTGTSRRYSTSDNGYNRSSYSGNSSRSGSSYNRSSTRSSSSYRSSGSSGRSSSSYSRSSGSSRSSYSSGSSSSSNRSSGSSRSSSSSSSSRSSGGRRGG